MKTLCKFISIGLLALLACMQSFATTPPLTKNGKLISSIATMIKRVNPSVVNIRTQIKSPTTDPFGRSRQKPQLAIPKLESLGSGVIVNAKKGYILTNAHVIHNAQAITVSLSDGRHLKAKLIGEDVPSDIAVIQIKAGGLQAMKMANSDNLQVGDFVAAIGDPFGLTHTVTSGIVSGLQRDYPRIEGYQNFIQTDASINPGNSGGALVNMQGLLIGINTAILAPDGGNIGIGFAIPSNMARAVMEQLIRYGKVKRGALGVIVQNLTVELAKVLGDPKLKGALIAMVSIDSPAAKIGIKTGDVITKVNGRPVKSSAQVGNIIGLIRTGNKVALTIVRNGKTILLHPVIEKRTKLSEGMKAKQPYLHGVAIKDFDESSPAHGDVRGILVLNIAADTPAWRAGLHPGDIIISADKRRVADIEELKNAASKTKDGLLLNLLRGNVAFYIVIKR